MGNTNGSPKWMIIKYDQIKDMAVQFSSTSTPSGTWNCCGGTAKIPAHPMAHEARHWGDPEVGIYGNEPGFV
jgi:hypothetical protein